MSELQYSTSPRAFFKFMEELGIAVDKTYLSISNKLVTNILSPLYISPPTHSELP